MTSAAAKKASKDPLDQLLIAELDQGSRMLKADMVAAISRGTENRWQALAIACWLLERRKDEKAKLEPFRQLRPSELYERLGIDLDDDDQDDDEEAADPTDRTPESS